MWRMHVWQSTSCLSYCTSYVPSRNLSPHTVYVLSQLCRIGLRMFEVNTTRNIIFELVHTKSKYILRVVLPWYIQNTLGQSLLCTYQVNTWYEPCPYYMQHTWYRRSMLVVFYVMYTLKTLGMYELSCVVFDFVCTKLIRNEWQYWTWYIPSWKLYSL